MSNFRETKIQKASVPKTPGSLRLQTHILGQNPRKRKFSMAAGTSPTKAIKGVGMSDSPSGGRVLGGMTSSTAPLKHEAVPKYNIGAGGPGFDNPDEP